MPFLHHLHQLVAEYGYFAIFALVALESAGVPMPGETALVSAAVFAEPRRLQHRLGHRLRFRRGDPRRQRGLLGRARIRLSALLPIRPLHRVDEGRLKVGAISLPAPRRQDRVLRPLRRHSAAFAAFLAGVNHLPWPRFLLFNALGGVVWASLFGLGGYFLGLAFEHYARPVGLAALIAAVIGAIAASRFIAHHEEALRAEAEAALPGPLVAPKRR